MELWIDLWVDCGWIADGLRMGCIVHGLWRIRRLVVDGLWIDCGWIVDWLWMGGGWVVDVL